MYTLELLFLLIVFRLCTALECYSGLKIIRGASTKKCERASDFCYNVTIDLAQFPEITMAGCSTVRCMLSPNKCIKQKLRGHEVIFCCCNTGDLCNSKFTNLTTFEMVKQGAKDIWKMFTNIH